MTEHGNTLEADPLLQLSEEEWWAYKAQLCKDLYLKGLEYPAWTDERAEWWYKSLTFFVDEFIQPKLPRPKFHDDWYWWLVREQNYLNLAPREHAKTSVHSVYRTVWEICVNRNVRFFILFSTTEVSKLVLAEIKGHLTQNPRIRTGFGIFNPMELPPEERTVAEDWSQYSITVNRDDFSLKDPTVVVTGALTNVLSRRADRLIADDLLTDKVAYSEAESTRLNRWFQNDVQPVLTADGQLVITGTPYRKGDFYDQIKELSIENGGLYKCFIGDAIVDEATRTALWPEMWSYEALEKLRLKLGYVPFNRNYRCRIVSDEDSPFPLIWFTGGEDERTHIVYKGCYEPMHRLGLTPPGVMKERWLRLLVMGVDPAIGTSASAKFFGLVLLGIDHEGRLPIVEIVRRQIKFVAQKRIIVELYELWKPRYVVVESNAYQQALLQGLEEVAPFLPIVPIQTGVGHLPDVGVPAMDLWAETGRFRFPRGDARSKELTDCLIDELHFWGKHNTSDLAMALWFAFQKLQPELERLGMLPNLEGMIFGDRLRYERSLVRGLSGMAVPRRTLHEVSRLAMNAPLAHLSATKFRRHKAEERAKEKL